MALGQVVRELSDIRVAIAPLVGSVAVLAVLRPHAHVVGTRCPDVLTMAIKLIALPFTLVGSARDPRKRALTMLEVVFPLSNIIVAIGPELLSSPVLEVIQESTLVNIAILVGVRPLSTHFVAHILALVDITVLEN